MRRSSTDALPREDETIHYTGARLAELLAISVESTVVMPGSRTSTSIAAAAPQQLFHEGPASEHSSATGPIAFTLSQPIAVDAAAAPGAASRVGAASVLRSAGGQAVAAPARPVSEAPMGLDVLGQAQLDRPF